MILNILLVICGLALIPVIYWYYILFKYRSLNKIPGPKPFILLGNLFPKNPFDLKETFEELHKEYGPTVRVYAGPKPTVLVTKPEDIQSILSSTSHLNKPFGYQLLKGWLGKGLIIADGPKWKPDRKVLNPTFGFKILETFMSSFNSNADILVKSLSKTVGKKSIDALDYTHIYALDVICETAMGEKLNGPDGTHGELLPHVNNILSVATWRFFCGWASIDLLFKLFAPSTYMNFNSSIKELHRISNEAINKRRKMIKEINSKKSEEIDEFYGKKKKALLDFMLEESNFSHEGIREQIDNFVFAAHDTTATALSYILLELSRNPNVQAKLLEEIKSVVGDKNTEITTSMLNEMPYLDMLIKEALRKHPPAPLIQRELSTDHYIDGVRCPKGTIVTMHIYQLHQNPEYYPNPEKFDPERFLPENHEKRPNFSFIPFSAGPRICIGYRFATMEMKVGLIKIVQALEVLPVSGFKERIGYTGVIKNENGFLIRFKNRY